MLKYSFQFNPIKHGVIPAATAGIDAVDFAAGNPVGGIVAGNVGAGVAYNATSRFVKKKMLDRIRANRAVGPDEAVKAIRAKMSPEAISAKANSVLQSRNMVANGSGRLLGKAGKGAKGILPTVVSSVAGVAAAFPSYLAGNYIGAKYAPIYTYKR